jgi:hypothetical protein
MMIMRQKKNPEDGRGMAENKTKRTIAVFLFEVACMLLAAAGIFLLEYTGILKQGTDYMLCHMVLVVLGIGIVGFELRMNVIRDRLEYDNGEHVGRFWLCFLLGMAVAFVSVFLPSAAWPFLPVFVLLGLFGSLNLAALAGTVLLAIPVCLTGAGAEVFLMYLISGLFGAALFGQLKSGFKAGGPFVFSLGCLLVCETAGTVLVLNARPELEYFLVPAVNLIVSGILLVGILKIFSEKVIYHYRENYLDLNDTENETLAALRQRDKSAYMKSVHIAYFCERIAGRLGFNQDALKCAGYYQGMGDKLQELLETQSFPPEVRLILEEYLNRSRPVQHRETAVLMASEAVVSAILRALSEAENQKVDYDEVIDTVFAGYQENGTFRQCDITMRDFDVMHKIFKEEKLYYDFLR